MLKKSSVYRQHKCFHGDPFCFWLHRTPWAVDRRRMLLRENLHPLAREKNRMEMQAPVRATEAGLTWAHWYLGPAVWTDCSGDTNNPQPHVSAERPESQYAVVFTYRCTQNSHLNTRVEAKIHAYAHTLSTHSSFHQDCLNVRQAKSLRDSHWHRGNESIFFKNSSWLHSP